MSIQCVLLLIHINTIQCLLCICNIIIIIIDYYYYYYYNITILLMKYNTNILYNVMCVMQCVCVQNIFY